MILSWLLDVGDAVFGALGVVLFLVWVNLSFKNQSLNMFSPT